MTGPHADFRKRPLLSSISPSKDGQARRFDVSWSPYGGERCSTPLGVLDTTSTYFTYDVWWYITDLSHVNNLEFDFNQVLPNRETIIFGTQCSFRLGRWKYTTIEGGRRIGTRRIRPAAAGSGRPTAGTIWSFNSIGTQPA